MDNSETEEKVENAPEVEIKETEKKLEDASEVEIKEPEEKTVTDNNPVTKKKKPFIVRLISGIFIFILVLILLIAAWLGVNYFLKADITEVVPPEYSLHLRTDSVWDSVNPLLDLQAADIILSEPNLAGAKSALIDFRQSTLRENKFVDYFLSRRLDFLLYGSGDFLVVLDTGILSGVVKLAPVALNFISVPNLSSVKTEGVSFYTYKAGENIFYIRIYKNLVIVSSNDKLFEHSLEGGFSSSYSLSKKQSFSGKLVSPFAVTADSLAVLSMLGQENPYVNAVKGCLPQDQLSTVDFGITDKKLKLAVNIPYDISVLPEESPVTALLSKESKIPAVVEKLPEFIQYYTVISAGSLSELKDAAFYAADKSLDLEGKWKTAQNLSGVVFHETLENLFFSWTDDEYAVVGLDQKPDPVFIIKVKDENKRREIFDTLFKSIILQNDTSLIMDNVRLPRIQLPDFFQGLLEGFGVRLPFPYYMSKDGYIYFSQSPENLAAINAALKSGTRLTQNAVWQETSKGISKQSSQYSSLSLFYNLERSIPFFLKSKSSVSKILELYNIGRLDLRIKKSAFEISLTAVENKESSAAGLAGFPVNIEGKISEGLFRSPVKNSRVVFYSQLNNIISYNLSSQEKLERSIDGLKFIIPCAEGTEIKGAKEKPALWAVTREGTVYLLDEKLKDFAGFPLMTGLAPISSGSVSKSNLVFCIQNQKYVIVSADASVKENVIDSFDDITSTPVYIDNSFIAFYERSFLGGIHIVHDDGESDFIPVDGIGFGSPDYLKLSDQVYVGFVNQAGLLHISKASAENPVQIQLDGVFYLNVKACGESFIALSEDGTLYSVSAKENSEESPLVIKTKVPHMTARSGKLSVADFDGDGKQEVFVCGDGNVIYGFRENLEMIGCFPVSGYGEPLFIDLDGNKKNECICYSLENKINGWNLIY